MKTIQCGGGDDADNAVDVNPDGDDNDNSCTRTPTVLHPWWAVDMEHDRNIVEVAITNTAGKIASPTKL